MRSLMIGFAGDHFDSLDVLSLGNACRRPELPSPFYIATGTHWAFPVLKRSTCVPEQIEEIVRHWNGLPAGEQARCHTPGFALELFVKGKSVFVAALCWRCNNISFGGSMASLSHREFEARSIPGSRLLQLCRRAITNAD